MSQSPMPFEQFYEISDNDCVSRIHRAKEILSDEVLILGHHYQREEVFQFADISGDSLKLSKEAAASSAKKIVFCGVHFMAEVADILTHDDQTVILPDLAAGCSMADMANLTHVERCWKELSSVLSPDETVTPVTYINSAADLKAFCGRHGGIVCTSSNAEAVLNWSFNQREKILFFPDQHLGRNTAFDMGIPLEQMVVWDFNQPMGGLTAQQIKQARMILWRGHCSVHQMFRPEHITRYREQHPEVKVISHPEASFEVCQMSDAVGSTEMILRTIRAAEEHTHWLVGTELNLVNRLQKEVASQGKTVTFMSPNVCMCSTMFRTDPQHLLWVLENLIEGVTVNQIKVSDTMKQEALASLERMFSVS